MLTTRTRFWALLAGGALLITAGTALAAPGDSEVKIDKRPTTTEEFVELRDKLAETPHGGAAVFAVALLTYSENPKLGQDFLTIAIDATYLTDSTTGYKGKAPLQRYMQNFKMRIAERPFVARSYFQGTAPANGYALPEPPLVVKIKEQSNDVTADAARVFIYSSGADTPRPIRLKKNDKGLWKAYEWSSLELGVRPPQQKKSDDL